LSLFGLALGAALTELLVLLSLGLGLVLEHLGTGLLCLLLVDVLHKDTLVLENVTLGLQVELVVHVLVELLSLAVLGQHAAEDAHTTDPEELDWHTGIGSTLALTGTSVATLAAGLGVQSCAGARVNNNWLADDQTVLDETSDLVARVGISNVGVLVGVKPDLVLATLHDGGGEPLLEDERAHFRPRRSNC